MSVNNIYKNRIYIAIIFSIIAHLLFILNLQSKNEQVIFIANDILSSPTSILNVTLSKISEPKIKKPEIIKKDVKKPITQNKTKPEKIENKISKITEPNKQPQESVNNIPIIDNPTYKGSRIPPIYPKRALMLKQQGVVFLKVLVNKKGDVEDIKIENSSGFSILDKSAIKAVYEWKFEPLFINNEASLSWVRVPVEFVIR